MFTTRYVSFDASESNGKRSLAVPNRRRIRLAAALQWGVWVGVAFMVCVYLWWLASGAL
jgi:hypothetical protein